MDKPLAQRADTAAFFKALGVTSLSGFKSRFYADKLPVPVPGQAPLVAEKVRKPVPHYTRAPLGFDDLPTDAAAAPCSPLNPQAPLSIHALPNFTLTSPPPLPAHPRSALPAPNRTSPRRK
jgi:hypothetical protein